MSSFTEPPKRHGCRSHCARSETVQGVAGQAGHDVRVADGEGEVGVRCKIAYAINY